MKILSTKGKGFKALKDEFHVEFGPLNIITGENYAGKTSLMTLLNVPLVGKKAFEKELKIEDYINDRCDKFEIKDYTFQHNDLIFIYNYTYSKKSNNKTLVVKDLNGNIVDEIEGVTLVDSYLAQNLGDPDLISIANISAQRSEKDFLFLDKAKKMETMRKILGIDTVDQAIENLKKSNKDSDKQIEVCKAEINVLNAQEFKLEEVPEKPKDYDEIILTYNKLNEENEKVEKIKTELTEYETNLSRLKDKKEEIAALTNSNTGLTNLLTEKKNELSKFETLDSDLKTVNDSIKNLESDKQALEYKKKETENYLTESRNIKIQQRDLLIAENSLNDSEFKTVEELKSIANVKKTLLNDDSILLNNLIEEIADIKSSIKDKKSHLDLSKQGICPTCKTEIKLTEDDIQKISEEITGQEKILGEKSVRKLDIENIIKKINEDIDSLNKKELDLNVLFNKIDTLKKGIKEKQDQLKKPEFETTEAITNKLTEIENSLTDLNSKKIELAKKDEERKTIKEAISSTEVTFNLNDSNIKVLNNQIKTIEDLVKDKDIVSLKNVVDNFDKKVFTDVTAKKNSYDILMNTIEINTQRNIEINKQIETRDKAVKEKTESIKTLTENINRDKESIDLFKKYISYRVNVGITSLIKMMNIFMADVHDSFDIKLENENDIEIIYSLDNGEHWHSTYSASGLEKQALAGAWKVALAHMQNIGILILDEPDDAASGDNSIKLLESFLRQNFEQVFLITHRAETIEYLMNEYNAKIIRMENGRIVK